MTTGYDADYRDRVSQALMEAIFGTCTVQDLGVINLRVFELFESLTDVMAFAIAAADHSEAHAIYKLLGKGFAPEVKRREKRYRKMLEENHIAEIRARH